MRLLLLRKDYYSHVDALRDTASVNRIMSRRARIALDMHIRIHVYSSSSSSASPPSQSQSQSQSQPSQSYCSRLVVGVAVVVDTTRSSRSRGQ